MDKFEIAFSKAIKLHEMGNVIEALKVYKELSIDYKNNPHLLFLLGVALFQSGEHDLGIKSVKRSIEIHPNPISYNNLGVMYSQKKDFFEAVASFERAIEQSPNYAEAFCNLGSALREMGKYKEALSNCQRAAELDAKNPAVFFSLANVYYDLKDYDSAVLNYKISIEADHNFHDSYLGLGISLFQKGMYEDAIATYNKAILINRNDAKTFFNKARSLGKLKRSIEALECYNNAIDLNKNYDEAFNNRGLIQKSERRFVEAIDSFDKAIAINPRYAEAWMNRGNLQVEIGCADDALKSFNRAIEINPKFAEAFSNRSNALMDLRRIDEAVEDLTRAIELNRDIKFLMGDLIYRKLKICEWDGLTDSIDELEKKIIGSTDTCAPFISHVIFDSLDITKKCAINYCHEKNYLGNRTLEVRSSKADGKIRVGYFSSDFGGHPVTYLLAGLLDAHDRDRFEVVAFSLMDRPLGEWRNRIVNSVDQFVDVSKMSDQNIAELARSFELDIAIDLNGYTKHSRPEIFTKRVAPVQASYIGFLGTMAMPCMDYILADEVLIPEESIGFYSEKIAYLPSYQYNDNVTNYPEKILSREQFGLPEGAFVYCSFNNNYKITPQVFISWLRILESVPNSLLWIYADNPIARENLIKQASYHGTKSDRLIFANKLPLGEHLARQRLADLFLDTYPYNAGATASSALRAGLPLLTRQGETFASRYCSSLLRAVGLPELVTYSVSEYEHMAIKLGLNPDLTAAITTKLSKNIQTSTLFDAKSFVHGLEDAYKIMYDNSMKGNPPLNIKVKC